MALVDFQNDVIHSSKLIAPRVEIVYTLASPPPTCLRQDLHSTLVSQEFDFSPSSSSILNREIEVFTAVDAYELESDYDIQLPNKPGIVIQGEITSVSRLRPRMFFD